MVNQRIGTILGATLLLAGCSAPPQTQVEDYGKRLRRECESVWREIKDSKYVKEETRITPDLFVDTCIVKRAMRSGTQETE